MSHLIIPTAGRAVFTWASPAVPADIWTLYELPHDEARYSVLWYPFKLMLPPGAPARWRRRRAYRLQWNALDLRFQKSHESHLLELTLPDLYERVELALSLTHGPEWLRDVMGISDADIEAERDRLAQAAADRRRRKRRASP